ncbi:MAG: type II secretion system F family protein [Armatimonadetes bacterium]|nr:type II secretion system F family protein [Armatimonadota bacterium]
MARKYRSPDRPPPRPRTEGVSLASWGANPLHCFIRITVGRVAMYLTQLGDLLNAGLTMHDAMGELADHAYDWRLRRMSREIATGAAAGQSLAEQLARYPQLLSPHVRGMLLAGERAGALPRVCQELAQELRAQQHARWHVAIAEVWFGLLFFVAVLVPGLPRMINPERPDIAAYVRYLTGVALPIYVGLILVWNGAKLIGSIPMLADLVQTFLYYLPGAGHLIRRAALNRAAVAMEALLRAGVEIQEALAMAAECSGNAVIRGQLQWASAQVRAGRPLDQALSRASFLPGPAKQSLVLGERAGTYERVLGAVAEDARANRARTVLLVNIGGYGVMLLVSAVVVAVIVYFAFSGYLNALLNANLE